MKIGDYETVRLLGKGGMSEVHEVENRRLGSRYALKMFAYAKGKEDEEVLGRFRTEGQLLAKLNHPRIVKVVDFGNDPGTGRPYFVMDLVLDGDGETRSLADVQAGSADEETIGRWYDDIREALAYIHGKGVIHRDLKLQNVLIGPDGHVVLTDFGISRIFDPDGKGSVIVDTIQTLVRVKEGRSLVMGSLGYMAPEIEMGVAASPASDWYALGVIVYRLLTGTWCDARTDVNGALAGYDPVWRDIIPKLLHSNPAARECVSYAEAKRAAADAAELAAEERYLREKRRGHFARHLARWLAAFALLLAGSLVYLQLKHGFERKAWELERRSPGARAAVGPTFDELFAIPAEAKADAVFDEQDNLLMPSSEDLAASRVDLLVITHRAFADLAIGAISLEKMVSDFERMQVLFEGETDDDFEDWPEGYMQAGTDEATAWLLERALDRLRELADR